MAEQTPEEKAAAEKATTEAANVAAGKNPDGTEKKPAEPTAAEKAATEAANIAAGKNADGSEKKPVNDGKPVVPEKYDLKLPEKAPFAEADLVAFGTEAKTLGLTQEQAQRMVTARVEAVQSTAAKYLEDLQGDKDLGGANFERTKALAIAGRDKFFETLPADEKAEVTGWFDRTGLGNHKALVRAFARLGKLIAEDKPLTAPVVEGKPKPGSNEAVAATLYPNDTQKAAQ